MKEYLLWCLANTCFYLGIGLYLYVGCKILEYLEKKGYFQFLVSEND